MLTCGILHDNGLYTCRVFDTESSPARYYQDRRCADSSYKYSIVISVLQRYFTSYLSFLSGWSGRIEQKVLYVHNIRRPCRPS